MVREAGAGRTCVEWLHIVSHGELRICKDQHSPTLKKTGDFVHCFLCKASCVQALAFHTGSGNLQQSGPNRRSDAGLLGSWHFSWGHPSSYLGFYCAWLAHSGVINVSGSENGELDHVQARFTATSNKLCWSKTGMGPRLGHIEGWTSTLNGRHWQCRVGSWVTEVFLRNNHPPSPEARSSRRRDTKLSHEHGWACVDVYCRFSLIYLPGSTVC